MNGEQQLVTVELNSQKRKSREQKSTDEEELEATAEKEIHPAYDPSVYQCPKCPRTYTKLKSLQTIAPRRMRGLTVVRSLYRGRETGSTRAQNPST